MRVFAATRTWTGAGATNNWSLAANWSGGVVPVAADTVVFDGTSVKNVTIDVNASVASLSINAGYTGTISQSAGRTITVGAGGWTQASGIFVGGTSAMTVNGPFLLSAGSFTSTSGTFTVTGNLTHSGGVLSALAGTVALSTSAATIDVPGSDTFLNLTLVSGTKTIAAGDVLTVTGVTTLTAGTLNGTGTLEAQGNLTVASGFTGGTATLLVDGAGAQTFTGAATTAAGNLPLFVINKASGTLTLAGTIRTTNNWTYTAGTVDPAASTVVFAGGTVSGSQTLNALDFRANTTLAAGTTLTATGSVSLTAGSLLGSGSLAAHGDVSQALAYGGGTATLAISGPGAQTLTGASTTASGNLPLVVINKPSGTLTLAGTIRTSNNWTYSAGTVDPAASTVVFAGGTISGSQTLNAVDFRANTTLAAGTTLTVGGSTTLSAGSLLGTGSLAAQGDVSQALAYGGGTATLAISGPGAQTLTGASTTASGNLPLVVINKPSGTLTLAGTIRTSNNWTYSAGTVDPAASTVVFAGGTISGSQTLNALDFRGTTSIAAGTTVTATGSVSLTTGSLNGTGTLAVQGALSQASTATGGTATLLVDGAGAQTFTGAATTAAGNLPLFVINKASGTLTLAGTIRTTNNWTYTAGTVDPAASTVVFAGGTVSGSQTLNALDFRANTTLAAGTTLTATGSVSLTAGSLLGSGSLAAHGDVSQALAYGGGTATLAISGPGAQTLTGASTTASGNLPLVVINKPSGTLTLAGTIRTSNNWTYSAGTVDPAASTVVFAGGTISGSQTLNAVDFRANTTLAAGTTLTVGGSTTLSAGSLLGTGSLAAHGDVSQALAYGGGTATLAISGPGAQTLTGASTTASGNLPLVVINKPSGTLTLAGTIRTSNNWTYSAGTVDPAASTVVFAGGTISGSQTLNAVDFRANTTLAAGTTLTVGGSTTLSAGSLLGTGSLAAQGDVSQALAYGGGTATLAISGPGAQTLTGASTTASGNLPLVVINKPSGTLTLAGTIRTSNNWTYSAGTVDPAASTVVFAGGTVSSAGMSFANVTTNGGTTTLGTAMAVGGDLSVTAGTFTTSASGYGLAVGGNLTVNGTLRENASAIAIKGNITNSGTIVPGTSTVTLNGASGQTIGGSVATPCFNLVVADPLGVTLNANLTVTGTLTLTSGQLNLAARLLTISNPIAGTTTNLVAGPASSMTVTGAGAGIVMPSSVSQLLGLTLSNASGLSLQVDLTVGGTLTLTSAPLDAGVNTVVIAPGGTVVRTGGRVVGNLRKHIAAGSAIGLTFEVGDATRYTPAAVVFGTVTTPGELTVRTTPGDHPDIANSGLAVARTVNRFWTLTNSGIVFDTYDPTFTFVAGDIDLGANPATFIVANLDALIWTRPSVGTRSALSTQATGITTFGDFAVGEPTADLAVSVSDGLASVVAGTGGHGYTITVTNGGPSDAAAVTLSDAFPAGFLQGSISPSQGSCAAVGPGPDFSCGLGTIPAGASATVTVAYSVPAGLAGGTQTNAVSVASPTSDPNSANDGATDGTMVVEVANLVVTKDDGLASVVAGTAGHAYTITVTNGGPSDADNLVVDDTVPAAFTVGTPIADLSGDCSGSAGNTIHCTLPASLPVGATWTITLPYGVGPGVAAQTVTNTATATSDENLAGVTAGDATDVTSAADLAVSVSDGLASVVAGTGGHGYTITVTNGGPSDAAAVTLSDAFPAGFLQGSISPSQGSCAAVGPGPDFSCGLGTIPAGASATVTVAYSVPAGLAGGTQTNAVSVASPTSDPNSANDGATDGTMVVEVANLVVTKDDGLASVVAGTAGHAYTITVTNGGPSDADNLVVDDTVPAAFTVGTPIADLSGDCSGSAGNTIHCTLPASLPVGATWTITLPYGVGPGVAAQTVTNTATATSDENLAGVTAGDATDVTSAADLAVSVSDGLASVVAGTGGHGYTITVTNGGPSDAAAVTLSDAFPAGFLQGSISPSQGSCAAVGPGPDFSCGLGTIPAGASATVTVAYSVPAGLAGGTQTNAVSVASPTSDPNSANDGATDGTMVVEVANLVVTKDDGLASVVAGTAGHAYTITVTNGGPSDADNLVVDDTVPAAFTVGTPIADLSGDCSGSAGNTIHCTLPASLPVGATWTITLPYGVGPGVAAQTVTNTATATSDENLAGVTAGDATDVTSAADLAVSVSDGLASVVAGTGGHGYTITVTNGGPSDAAAVTLSDAFPAGFLQGSISPSQGSCAAVGPGPDFSCGLGTIPAGASATVTVAYSVPAGLAGGTQTNAVSVASPTSDPNSANDGATDGTMVGPVITYSGDLPATDASSRAAPPVIEAPLAALLLAVGSALGVLVAVWLGRPARRRDRR